ncbi:hypothetical protein JHK82_040020 [Glycine max]|nr:hypothetical protein JHK85_040802 [Glycine max]KAG5110797.1 hypothetical protein JHK82_040020 [Glycine max]KAG5122093.1 hypothetical protein JHK84_040433 [Glycine max]
MSEWSPQSSVTSTRCTHHMLYQRMLPRSSYFSRANSNSKARCDSSSLRYKQVSLKYHNSMRDMNPHGIYIAGHTHSLYELRQARRHLNVTRFDLRRLEAIYGTLDEEGEQARDIMSKERVTWRERAIGERGHREIDNPQERVSS